MTRKFFVLFLLLCNLCGFTQVKDTTAGLPQTVVIKIFETNLTNWVSPKMIVVHPTGKIETKDLDRINFDIGNSALETNAYKLRQEIQNWQNKGFELKSSNSISPEMKMIISTYVLQKK